MNYNNTIAVIVPVSNNDKWLEYCLDSIVKQTNKNFEVLIVDYGLSPEGYNVGLRYTKNHNNFQLLKSIDKSLHTALSTALLHTKCSYSTIVYPEDFLDTRYIEELSSKKDLSDIVVPSVYTYNEESKLYSFYSFNYKEIITRKDILDLKNNLFFNTISGKLIKTELLRKFRNFTIVEEELAFWLYHRVEKIATCKNNLYVKRVNIKDRPGYIDKVKNNQNYLISIIVPIYDVEKYLRYCIDSLVNQTYKNIEILLINDSSPDNSLEICNEYAKKDSRIKVFTKENGGLSDARNYGVTKANGDFIYFVDSDDWIKEETIQGLYTQQVMHNADIVAANHIMYHEAKKSFGLYIHDKDYHISVLTPTLAYQYQNSWNHNESVFIVAWGKLYKKELFNNIEYPVGRIFEDEQTTHKLFFSANKIVYIHNNYYYYRQRPGSIMRSGYNIKRAYDMVDMLNEKMADIILYGVDIELFKDRMFRLLRFTKDQIERNNLTSDPIYKRICKKLEFFYTDEISKEKNTQKNSDN